ncbi:MAG: hypothetical protein Q7S43_03930 [bacterium]|nr:hypothetical protein [bacterium]
MTMNKGEFRAEYRPGKIPPSKPIDIEKLMPVFRELAAIFKVNIAVDYSDGWPIDIREDVMEPETINFHIDAFPSKFHVVTTISGHAVFGLIPSRPISIEVAVPHKSTVQYRLAKTELYSPEAQHIGCILGSHVFIYPRILTADAWVNADDLKLLWAISYWFLPKAIQNVLPNYGTNVANGLNTLRSTRRDMYLPHYATVDQFKKTFRLFLTNMNARLLEILEEAVAVAEKRLDKLSCDYFDSIGQNVQNMTRLELVTTEISKRDLGKEFETLLTMESIETVRIRDGRYLLIKTSPIFQIPAVDHEKKTSESYDIGEFMIRIDTDNALTNRSLSRSGIRFYQDGYTGPFSHAHLTPNSDICFGNNNQPNNVGLNTTIDGLMARFDTVPLVHLILTFMKKERSRPNERNKWDDTIRPLPDSYKTADEREIEKNRFIQLVADASIRTSAGYLKKDIAELNKKISSLHEEIIIVKTSLQINGAMLEKLNDFLTDAGDIDREADRLLDEPSIFGLFISDQELVIHFHCQRIDLLESAYPPEDFILKLNVGSTPKLLTLSSKKSLQSTQLLDIQRLDPTLISKDDEDLVRNVHFGRILEILRMTGERIINKTLNPGSEILTKKGTKNER